MQSHLSYKSIGTYDSPETLTAVFADNRAIHLSKFLTNLHINGKYTPKAGETDRKLYIKIEVSEDREDWHPLAIRQNTTTESLAYVDGADGTFGIPMTVPGDKTSTGGTAIPFNFDLNVVAQWVRISAREDGASDFGTIYLETALNAN